LTLKFFFYNNWYQKNNLYQLKNVQLKISKDVYENLAPTRVTDPNRSDIDTSFMTPNNTYISGSQPSVGYSGMFIIKLTIIFKELLSVFVKT
jgi:hypothetical protein